MVEAVLLHKGVMNRQCARDKPNYPSGGITCPRTRLQVTSWVLFAPAAQEDSQQLADLCSCHSRRTNSLDMSELET